jgi:RND family efflux transporter MFP subunit
MTKVKKIVICAVIVIVVIGAIVVKNNLPSSAKNANVVVTVSKTAVDVQMVKMVEKNSGDTYKANLEAYQQGIISSKISGKVVSVAFENGQYVNQGDTLIILDDQDIRNNIKTSQAQLQTYQAQLNSSQVAMEKLKINLDDAKRNYDRQKTLFEKKAIAQTDFEAAEKTVNTAQADYDSGNASIQTAQANISTQNVSIANLQDSLNNTIIKAPIGGAISDKAVNIGQMASQGTALAKVNDISSVYATIQIPQDKINSVKTGQAATITVEGSDKTYDGVVQNIDLSADATARVFNCKIKIDNSNKTLYPGIYAKAELISSEKTQVISVPINALVGNEGDYSVFINDNGTSKKQKVTIGETNENNVEITSGIKDGDEIICTNTSTLQDGAEVEAVSALEG